MRHLDYRRGAGLLLMGALSTAACTQEVERVPEPYRPSNAHEAYAQGLATANLAGSALARDWIAAAENAIRYPMTVTTPFRETGYFDASSAAAVGYVFTVTAGQRIQARVDLDSGEPVDLFLDLFRLVGDDRAAPVHIASGSPLVETGTLGALTASMTTLVQSTRRLHFEPLRDATYVLRVQPELLRSTRYTVLLQTDASLSFPVAGLDAGAIQSSFGASRDAGRRSHHGVDIFASRGTPVLAAANGLVTRANTTEVGGNVVWVRDTERNINLYYAHLDSQSVERGQRVRVGDLLGTVGNTGNARTTPPHLHFGVYARGPVDPYPFLARRRLDPVPLSVELDRLGDWSRTAADVVAVLAGPDRDADLIQTVSRNAPLRVWAASARWYRVALPDGTTGYVAGDDTEIVTPLRTAEIVGTRRVLARPAQQAAVIDQLSAGVGVPVLGNFAEFLYVRTPAGRTGWLSFE